MTGRARRQQRRDSWLEAFADGRFGKLLRERERVPHVVEDEFSGLTRDHLVGTVQGMRVVVTEQQARLDAIAGLITWWPEDPQKCVDAIFALARGTPKRAVALALKRWGKKP